MLQDRFAYPWHREAHLDGVAIDQLKRDFPQHLDVLDGPDQQPLAVRWRNLDTGVEILTQIRHRATSGASAIIWAECDVKSPHFGGVRSIGGALRAELGDEAEAVIHRRDDKLIDEFYERVVRTVERSLALD